MNPKATKNKNRNLMNKIMFTSYKTVLHRKRPNQKFSVPIYLATVYNLQHLVSVFE